jgi:hypothetical protein
VPEDISIAPVYNTEAIISLYLLGSFEKIKNDTCHAITTPTNP